MATGRNRACRRHRFSVELQLLIPQYHIVFEHSLIISNLKVVRQFCAAGVTRIHRDEYSTRGDKGDLPPLEHKPLRLKTQYHTIVSLMQKIASSCAPCNIGSYD